MVRGTDDQYTVEELASAAGVPTRTIRYYQGQGALPPPRRVGRLAYYDTDHLERLRLIALLRDRGLRLDAITEVLGQVVTGGDSLQGWLGLTEFSATSWTDEQPVLLSADELRRRCRGDDLLVDELVLIGAVQQEMGLTEPYFLVSSPSMLASLLAMTDAGMAPQVSLQAAALMKRHLGEMADKLVAQYARHFHDDPRFVHDRAQQLRSLDALRSVAFGAVRTIFAREIERHVREVIVEGPLAFIERTASLGTGVAAGDRDLHDAG